MITAEHWSVFLKYITDTTKRGKINEILEGEEGIAMASEVLISISKDEVERARLMSEYKYEVDNQSKMIQAKREAENRILEMLKNGKSPEDVLKLYGVL